MAVISLQMWKRWYHRSVSDQAVVTVLHTTAVLINMMTSPLGVNLKQLESVWQLFTTFYLINVFIFGLTIYPSLFRFFHTLIWILSGRSLTFSRFLLVSLLKYWAGEICIEPDLFQLVNIIQIEKSSCFDFTSHIYSWKMKDGQLVCFSNKLAYMMVVLM